MDAPLSVERLRVLQRLLEIDPGDLEARRQLDELQQERGRLREIGRLLRDADACVKYKLPVKIVVVKNNTLGMINTKSPEDRADRSVRFVS